MKSVRAVSIGRVYVTAAVLFAATLNGCNSNEEFKSPDRDSLSVSVHDPVDRDFTAIMENGILRIITQYSSSTYFLHQGVEVGFEYELLRDFADEHDLDLEVVIIGAGENPYDLLNSGAGDVIAAHYAITPDRSEVVRFTRPYNLTDQVVVYSEGLRRMAWSLEELSGSGIPITVRKNSSYYTRLQELNRQGYDFTIRIAPADMDTESLLLQVANGNIEATVSDDNILSVIRRNIDGLIEGPVIAENDTIAWAVRKNAPELEGKLSSYLNKHFRFTDERAEPKRSAFLNILRQRYFGGGQQIAQYFNPDLHYAGSGLISPYDDIVKQVADSLDLDWLMLTAMIAQESMFNPNSKSWAGAVGLMQIIPRFSEVGYEDLYDPEINIREGARIIKDHLDHYAYLDSLNQWAMALATYNVGLGHMADARRLVVDRNKNPNEWENVEAALLSLMQRRYYQDARYGYARGIETVQYVREVKNRYRMYQRVTTIAEQRAAAGVGIFGMGTVNLP